MRAKVYVYRTPENRGEGRLDRLGKKFGLKIGGFGRKVRTGTDLPKSGKICSDRHQKIPKNPQKILGDRIGLMRLSRMHVGINIGY